MAAASAVATVETVKWAWSQ